MKKSNSTEFALFFYPEFSSNSLYPFSFYLEVFPTANGTPIIQG